MRYFHVVAYFSFYFFWGGADLRSYDCGFVSIYPHGGIKGVD